MASDFNALVLAQLQKIVESQSEILASQFRITKTFESLEGRFQTETSQSPDLELNEGGANCVGLVGLSSETLGKGSSSPVHSEPPCRPSARSCTETDMSWPASICPRYFVDATKSSKLSNRRSAILLDDPIPSTSSPWCVALSDSWLQILLDFVSVILVLWDLTTTSFLLSWDMKYTGIVWVGICVSAPFWTLDIMRHFFIAFYQNGELQTQRRAIAMSYIKTYFFIDLFVLIFDWVFLDLLTTHGSQNHWISIRAVKFVRLVRIIDLLRTSSRLLGSWNLYAERKFGERVRLIISYLVVPTLYILWALHFLACLFYAVGASRAGKNGGSWFDTVGDLEGGTAFVQLPLLDQYLAVFHFAIAAVSLAGNFEGHVTSASERGVMLFALVVGFVFGSVFISFISAVIVDYQMKQNANSSRLRQLRKYLCENDVGSTTYQRVVKQAEQRLLASDRLKEEDVHALTFLSTTYMTDVRLEIQWPPLQRHALFRLYQMLDETVPRRLCKHALAYVDLSVGDELFKGRDEANYAYILTLGLIEYVQTPLMSKVDCLTSTDVKPGGWLAEAALFSRWHHVGVASARLSSRLLTIDSAEVVKVVLHRDPLVHAIAVEYGCEFHRRITLSSPPEAWPNDLGVPSTDYCEVVLSLSSQCQIEIGKCAIGTLSHSRSQALLDEVLVSKAVIILTGDGAVYRIKSIVVLRVEDEGLLLAQIGKVKGGSLSPSVMLPACTLERGEFVSDCLSRVLKTKFSFLEGNISVVRTVCEVVESESKEFSVQTRYYRSVVYYEWNYTAHLNLPVIGSDNVSRKSSAKRTQSFVLRNGFRPPLSLHAAIDWNDKENGTIYAWLSEREYEALQSAAGTEWLMTWLSERELDPPPLRCV